MLVSAVLLLGLSGCETACRRRAIQVHLSQANPPVFSILSDEFGVSFSLKEVNEKNQTQPPGGQVYPNISLWTLQFDDQQGFFDRHRTAHLETLTYGQIPPGYRQLIPANNTPPPPLRENKIYEAMVTTNAGGNPGVVWFKVQGATSVAVPIPKP